MYYETLDSVGGLDSTTYYYYNDRGNPRYVMTERENPTGGEKRFTGTRLAYARNKMAVTYAIGEEWDDATSCIAPTGYEMLYAYEYRYDGARARYLKRSLDPAELLQGNFVSLGDTWTDYDGSAAYGDFTIDSQSNLTYEHWYLPGIAMGSDVADPGATAYYHTDLIGTTRVMSDSIGAAISQFEYTAFGVPYPLEGGGDQRYGYAGAWGYQSDAAPGPAPSVGAMPYLHVGARYYDPAIGRFLQRDPIGLFGGTGVYPYATDAPTFAVDPSGTNPGIDARADAAFEFGRWLRTPTGQSKEEMEKELRNTRIVITICSTAIGGLISGGLGGWITGALGGSAEFGGAVGGTIGGGVGGGIGALAGS